jgi:uncharacterized membrane protein
MEEALARLTHLVAFVIDLMALVIVAFGAIEAFVAASRLPFEHGTPRGDERRAIWIRFARWLIAGLTFQLAADIVGTAIAPAWDEIGRLAAIAASVRSSTTSSIATWSTCASGSIRPPVRSRPSAPV